MSFRTKADRLKVLSDTTGVTLTKQSMQKECDVNEILKKYRTTGVLTHVKGSEGAYLDVSGIRGYHESLNVVVAAQEAFEGLPADLRRRFGNDPGVFVDFCEDPNNAQELVRLGLAEVRQEEAVEAPRKSGSKKSGPAPSEQVPAAGEGPKT